MSSRNFMTARRIFARSRSNLVVLFGVLPVFLGACTGMDSATDTTRAETWHKNKVEWVNMDYDVAFNPGSGQMTPQEKHRLHNFLTSAGTSPSDSITVDPGGPMDALTRQRVMAVRIEIEVAVKGIWPTTRRVGVDSDGKIRVIVGRYLVMTPECPAFTAPSHRNPGNIRSSNFGCSSEVNLGLMVADPGDLVRGNPLSAGEGQVVAAGIERYRAGEVRELSGTSIGSD